jgi:hypothetical protein
MSFSSLKSWLLLDWISVQTDTQGYMFLNMLYPLYIK